VTLSGSAKAITWRATVSTAYSGSGIGLERLLDDLWVQTLIELEVADAEELCNAPG
jgi:hypothetical protein